MAGFIHNGTFTIADQPKIFHGLFSWFNIKVSQKYQLIVEEKALEEKAYVILPIFLDGLISGLYEDYTNKIATSFFFSLAL